MDGKAVLIDDTPVTRLLPALRAKMIDPEQETEGMDLLDASVDSPKSVARVNQAPLPGDRSDRPVRVEGSRGHSGGAAPNEPPCGSQAEARHTHDRSLGNPELGPQDALLAADVPWQVGGLNGGLGPREAETSAGGSRAGTRRPREKCYATKTRMDDSMQLLRL